MVKPFLLAVFSFVVFVFIGLINPEPAQALLVDSAGGGGSPPTPTPAYSCAALGGFCTLRNDPEGCTGGYMTYNQQCVNSYGSRWSCCRGSIYGGSGGGGGSAQSAPAVQRFYNDSICNGNSVINCGAWSKNAFNNKWWNGDGLHSGSNIRWVYSEFGINLADFNSGNTVNGYATWNDRVYLSNGELVGTNTVSGGRYYMNGAYRQGQLWMKPNHLVFLSSRIDVYVHMVNGVFQWAVMKPCGNVLLGTPVATPTPTPIPVYTIDGYVYNDTNKNRLKDNRSDNYPETKDWTGNITVTTSGGSLSVNSNTNPANGAPTDANAGRYTVSNVIAGTYTISYTSALPTTPIPYKLLYPRTGPPPQYSVTVGPSCNVDRTTGAVCSARGDVSSLNFAITNSIPWTQTYGLDLRIDDGFNDIIPANPFYPPYASVSDAASGISSDAVTPTPTRTPTPTPTRTPTPVPPTATPTSIPNWGACNAAGHPGICYDRNTTSCGRYYDAGNYCPGGDSIQCCVNNQVACRSSGQCHNRYANSGGNIYSCSQTWYSGYCPGPFDVQCCAP